MPVAPAPPAPRPRGRFGGLTSVLGLLRPEQWSKNLLVLLAPLTTAPVAVVRNPAPMAAVLVAFAAASSLVYVLNDWLDRERDRRHPEKRHRPLASGRVGSTGALAAAAGCVLVLVACLLVVPAGSAALIGLYLTCNVAYCFRLKHQPLVDVSVVALGFTLRVAAGSMAAHIPLSVHLVICVYCSCLLLALGKRRHELSQHAESAEAADHRPALRHYSVGLLDSLMVVMLATTLVSYLLFVDNDAVFRHPIVASMTLPLAVFAGARYLQLVVVHGTGGAPGRDLARDRAMQINAVLWLGLLVVGAST